MDFERARAEYARLRQAYDSRQISAQEYGQRVQSLQVRDASGGFWAIDGNTGGWLRYDGSNWVPGQPPIPQAPAPQFGGYGAPQQPQQPQRPQQPQQPQQPYGQQPPFGQQQATPIAQPGGFAQQPQGGFAGVPQVGAAPQPAAKRGGRTVLLGCSIAGVLLLLCVVVGGILIARGSGGVLAALGGGSGVTEAATARSLTDDKRPDQKATDFTVGTELYITYTARSVKKDETIVLKLYRNNEALAGLTGTTTVFPKDSTYYGHFTFQPDQAGSYRAELLYNGETTPSQTLEFTVK